MRDVLIVVCGLLDWKCPNGATLMPPVDCEVFKFPRTFPRCVRAPATAHSLRSVSVRRNTQESCPASAISDELPRLQIATR